MEYDFVIVLAHELDEQMKPSEQTRERLDLGLELFEGGNVKYLLMSGGHRDAGIRYKISIAEAMKQYAVSKGVPEQSILLEEICLDTVGQFVFCKLGILDILGAKNIVIVSHEYHMPRVKTIAEKIFGNKYALEFKSVQGEIGQSVAEKEEKSRHAFLSTFNEREYSDSMLLGTLLTKHSAYKQNPDLFRNSLEKLKQDSRLLLQ